MGYRMKKLIIILLFAVGMCGCEMTSDDDETITAQGDIIIITNSDGSVERIKPQIEGNHEEGD